MRLHGGIRITTISIQRLFGILPNEHVSHKTSFFFVLYVIVVHMGSQCLSSKLFNWMEGLDVVPAMWCRFLLNKYWWYHNHKQPFWVFLWIQKIMEIWLGQIYCFQWNEVLSTKNGTPSLALINFFLLFLLQTSFYNLWVLFFELYYFDKWNKKNVVPIFLKIFYKIFLLLRKSSEHRIFKLST